VKTAKEILSIITCNGMRELTEERAEQAMKDYAEQFIHEAWEIAEVNAAFDRIHKTVSEPNIRILLNELK